MPRSRDFDVRTIDFLKKQGFQGTSALDIGARWSPIHGAGLEKGLARFGVQRYVILEIWPPNVKELQEHGFAATLGDVRHVTEMFPKNAFDVVCWFHGIEHLESFTDIAQTLPKLAQVAAKSVLLSFPIGREPQGAVGGNPYEKHSYYIEANLVPRVAGCFPAGHVAWRIYARPPHKAGKQYVKFCPNCVMLWKKGAR